MWYLYILECEDKSLYTGITNSLEKRMGHTFRGMVQNTQNLTVPISLCTPNASKIKARH